MTDEIPNSPRSCRNTWSDLISARRAPVLVYIANLLLRTIAIVHSEMERDSDGQSVKIDVEFGDLPRPDRSQPAQVASESSHA